MVLPLKSAHNGFWKKKEEGENKDFLSICLIWCIGLFLYY